jgi:hypothetical protein
VAIDRETGIDDDYEKWVEENEEGLKDEYIEHLSDKGKLYEYVFFWEGGEAERNRQAAKAREAWESYLQAAYDEYCDEEGPYEDS